MTVMKKSSRILERPTRTKEETKNLHNNGKDKQPRSNSCYFDSGCTTEAISPEIVQIVALKVHQLTEQIPITIGY